MYDPREEQGLSKTITWKRDENNALKEYRKEIWGDHCPTCDSFVEFFQETDRWIQMRDGRWRHSSFSQPIANCGNCNQTREVQAS